MKNSAFTLAETICAFAVLTLTAVMLLSSVSVSASFAAAASDIRNSADAAAAKLYRKESASLDSRVLVCEENGTAAEGPEVTLYICDITDNIRFYYYNGEKAGALS